jgi:hypothetical protein
MPLNARPSTSRIPQIHKLNWILSSFSKYCRGLHKYGPVRRIQAVARIEMRTRWWGVDSVVLQMTWAFGESLNRIRTALPVEVPFLKILHR